MENMDVSGATTSPSFWMGRRVFITGHTGFKGSWLCMWLSSMGAKIFGYALDPPTEPSLFKLANVMEFLSSHHVADVRDAERLRLAIAESEPEVVIHMAAQPLVRDSYCIPVETYAINVMGTVHLLEAVRSCTSVMAVLNVTTDKCYENREKSMGYREEEPLGGYDPYSNSKACSELVTAAYRSSFFNPREYDRHGVAIATARAGNVIGGGDWATDRLIPDCIRALLKEDEIVVRNPAAVRPWQHVLEPLSGYLLLVEKLCTAGTAFSGSWNFGPGDVDAKPVEWMVQKLCSSWGSEATYRHLVGNHPHETSFLKLDSSKAAEELGWRPRWSLEKALESIICWSTAYKQGIDLRQVSLSQIREFEAD